MILSIYKIIEENTGRTFYDLELNNFVCSLDTEKGLSKTITAIEEDSFEGQLILKDLVSLPTLYSNSPTSYCTIIIASFEFLDASDLQTRLRSVIESNHPELLI